MSERPVHPVVRHLAARDAAARELGMEVLEARPGYARCALTVAPRHANPHGVCHGGVLFTFADSAFGYACNAHNHVTVAQAADIDFVRPGKLGERLVAVAEERARSGRSGVYDVTVATEAGEVVALLRGRSRVVGGAILADQMPDDQAETPSR